MRDSRVLVPSSLQLDAYLGELGDALLSRGAAQQTEVAALVDSDDVRETEEVERLGPKPEGAASLARVPTESKQARLLRVQGQAEGRESLRKRREHRPPIVCPRFAARRCPCRFFARWGEQTVAPNDLDP
jgi:hypothetical protein